jgi:hypothetical protein
VSDSPTVDEAADLYGAKDPQLGAMLRWEREPSTCKHSTRTSLRKTSRLLRETTRSYEGYERGVQVAKMFACCPARHLGQGKAPPSPSQQRGGYHILFETINEATAGLNISPIHFHKVLVLPERPLSLISA